MTEEKKMCVFNGCDKPSFMCWNVYGQTLDLCLEHSIKFKEDCFKDEEIKGKITWK